MIICWVFLQTQNEKPKWRQQQWATNEKLFKEEDECDDILIQYFCCVVGFFLLFPHTYRTTKKELNFGCGDKIVCIIICWFFSVNDKLMTLFFPFSLSLLRLPLTGILPEHVQTTTNTLSLAPAILTYYFIISSDICCFHIRTSFRYS